jgi:hypothetical protein
VQEGQFFEEVCEQHILTSLILSQTSLAKTLGSVPMLYWQNPTLSEAQPLVCKNGDKDLFSAALLKKIR